MTLTNNIWVFDIDGVITDPVTKKVLNPQIIATIEKRLSQKIPVCFNTGRSAQWIKETIIPHFNPKTSLELLYCSCEMGEVSLEYDSRNSPHETIYHHNLIPAELKATIREIVLSSYDETMFVDETKKSILTIEMKDGLSQDVYEEHQSRLSGEIRIILKNYHPGIHIRPSSSSIAIDIKPISSNKATGATKIMEWLRTKKIDLTNLTITAFGDSTSDLQMAEYFVSQSIPTKFIYVGTDNLDPTLPYPVIKTKARYTAGTLEFLVS